MDKIDRKRSIAAYIVILCANLVIFLGIWLSNTYDSVRFDQILYQIQASARGAQRNLTLSGFIEIGGYGVILTVVDIWLYLVTAGYKKTRLNIKDCVQRFSKKAFLPISCTVLVFSAIALIHRLEIIPYIRTVTTESDFIKRQYVDPDNALLKFPKEKRNLIYIFLESMENTYAEPEVGGKITDNFIKELTELSRENISFSNKRGIGGARMYAGTTWTAAALVAQTSGLVVKVPLTAESYNGENGYMPGITSIGDILQKQGYQQSVLFGSDAAFANRDSYFSEHGNYHIIDINSLKKEGKLPEDYEEWWGFEDQKLFAFAKEELLRLSQSEEPFNFTMLTADTHFPDGYVCPLCEEEYEEQYANVLACSARQVNEFINWIKEQPFYENTTIVISGDHLTMDPEFMDGNDEDYDRTIYNCIINSAVDPIREKDREFGSYDMFPTTLAAMGVDIIGDRLGLGVNLFSSEPTLTERYGFEKLNEELQMYSEFYNEGILHLEEE